MKDNYTHIAIVLDRSGSMEHVKSDTIGGFNQFLKDQQETPGEATLTLAQFDNVYEVLQDAKDIKAIEPLTDKTFVPRGGTALLDAIGRTIQNVGKFLSELPEEKRPGKVVFVVITDGFENASKQFTAEAINDMVQHQRDVYQWEFVFLGANQDAITTAASMGMPAANSLTYAATARGTQSSYDSVSGNLSAFRMGEVKCMAFTPEDRKKQAEEGAIGGLAVPVTSTSTASPYFPKRPVPPERKGR